jgi:hypothetical protein
VKISFVIFYWTGSRHKDIERQSERTISRLTRRYSRADPFETFHNVNSNLVAYGGMFFQDDNDQRSSTPLLNVLVLDRADGFFAL